ncbi:MULTISPECIES: hypothetical protein [Micrococcus]|uniref:Uncharacterized protein n=1 Tax=Micrococcus terreus TaxID=574650 RepID=A0A1I7MQW5_9MICC|nr:hypothetical protein [Micrococcus terreus]SFV24325.1 hypothetical protein SAMN04487966_110108 [Micrococcus terreus]
MGMNHTLAVWARPLTPQLLTDLGLDGPTLTSTYEQASQHGSAGQIAVAPVGEQTLLVSPDVELSELLIRPLPGRRWVGSMSSVASVGDYQVWDGSSCLRVLRTMEGEVTEEGEPVGDESSWDSEDTDSLETLVLEASGAAAHLDLTRLVWLPMTGCSYDPESIWAD